MGAAGHQRTERTLIGAAVVGVSMLLAWGAASIPSAAGYAGVGPNFLPWIVSAVLAACGATLVWQAQRGGWRDVEVPSGASRGDWRALGWVSAGVLANAALIGGFSGTFGGVQVSVPGIGFVGSCTLGYVLAVRGLRISQGRPAGAAARTGLDVASGLVIALPVYWLFSKLLGINLPHLTATGWL